MALHTEGIREAQGHLGTVLLGDLGGREKCRLGLIAIPEVALEVEHLRLGHHLQVQITGIETD